MIKVRQEDMKNIRHMAETCLEMLGDDADGLEFFRRRKLKGKQEGKHEGKLESKLEIARAMKADDLSDADIARYTGLEIEVIQQL